MLSVTSDLRERSGNVMETKTDRSVIGSGGNVSDCVQASQRMMVRVRNSKYLRRVTVTEAKLLPDYTGFLSLSPSCRQLSRSDYQQNIRASQAGGNH